MIKADAGIRRYSVVVVSSCGPSGNFLVNSLKEVADLKAIIRPRWRPVASSPPSVILKKALAHPLRTLSGRLNAWSCARATNQVDAEMAQLLGVTENTIPHELVREVDRLEINSEAVQNLLKQLAPQILISHGAPIMRPEIYSIPSVAALNIHFGILPQYRGEHTLFWPLILKDYAHIGASIHRLTDKVDGGPILARCYPELVDGDSEASIAAKSIRLAVKALGELLTQPSLPSGEKQFSEHSKLVRFRDRTWLRELQGRLLSHAKIPFRAELVERMYVRGNGSA